LPRHRLYFTLSVVAALAAGTLTGVFIAGRSPDTTPTAQSAQEDPASSSASAANTSSAAPAPGGTGKLGAAPRRSPSHPATTPEQDVPSGWPGPDNTGVPAGTRLKSSGSITITKAGTVIDRLDINGCINVRASNVTIKRTRVRGSCASGTISTGDGNRYTNILIQDVEADALKRSTSYPVIAFSGFTCRRCNVHGGGHGIQLGRNVVVEDSWIHDTASGDGSHNNAIAAFSSFDLVFRHNRLECLVTNTCTAALALLEDSGPVHDVLAEENLFVGGGYCVYGGVYGSGSVNVKFRRNAFSRTPFQKCGEYGPVTAFSLGGSGNEWSGNYWNDATKAAVTP
jgi:hypothetical protein